MSKSKQKPKGSPAAQHDGWIAFWVDPRDKMQMLAVGLVIVLSASKEITKETTLAKAMKSWPADMPMFADDLDELAFKIEDAAAAYREEFGNGNDAARWNK
jgi:hypothetical protein